MPVRRMSILRTQTAASRKSSRVWRLLVLTHSSRLDAPNVAELVIRKPDRAKAGTDAIAAGSRPTFGDLVGLRVDPQERRLWHRHPNASEPRCNAATVSGNVRGDRRDDTGGLRIDLRHGPV